jgi:AcrR family transcriptional regulator
MERARGEIVAAAAALIAESGLAAVTMAGTARTAGVAKATVYNHVRDRGELLSAVLTDQWAALQRDCAAQPPERRLGAAAAWVSESPVLDGLRRHDPDVVVAISAAALTDPAVVEVVGTWIPDGRDPQAALRWLISFAICPAQP